MDTKELARLGNLASGGGGTCSLVNCKLIFGLYYKNTKYVLPTIKDTILW